VGSKDHLYNTLDDLFAENADLAKEIKSEHVIAGEGVNGKADEFLVDIQAADNLSDNAKALNSNKRQANVLAWDAYKNGARTIFETASQNKRAAGQPLEELNKLYEEFSYWISEARGMEVNEASRIMQKNLMQDGIYGVLAGNKKIDIPKLWGQFDMPGQPPKGLSRQDFKNLVMEFFYSEQNKRWAGYRDETFVQIETFLERLKALEPNVNTTPDFMQKARELYFDAKKLDDAYMGKQGGQAVMKPLQELIAKDIADGKNSNAIRRLAQRYGIGEPGQKLSKYYDNYISAVLNKYGGYDPKTATLQDAWKAFEARVAGKGGLPQIENLDEWLKVAPETIFNPPMGNQVASLPRTLHEQLPGLRAFLDDLKVKIDQNWGNYTGGNLTAEQENALSAYLKTTGNVRMQESRRLANAVATAQRKFTILDYGDRTNFDLALSMVMPYHFWYSRTYGNWMKRFMQNPALLAHYARYRETLEQIHAGAPEWYKYQVNTNELLGLDSENPWYWNLEATLNPLNGLTGVDFTDPAKRVNSLTRLMEDSARFGPSIWTPFTMAMAYGLYNNGQQEAAAKWGGRLFPQTATLKSLASLANIRLPGSTQYNVLESELYTRLLYFSANTLISVWPTSFEPRANIVVL